MKTTRIYQPGAYQEKATIELNSEAAQHVAVVLRMQVGEVLYLFDGKNHEFTAEIISIHKKSVRVLIQSAETIDRESPLKIHLAPVVSKGDRMEIIVQKAVELGVHAITPLVSERCVVRLSTERFDKKQAQWQAIAVAACEQCGRNKIPIIHPVNSLEDYASSPRQGAQLVLAPTVLQTWRTLPTPLTEAHVIIGPEGGLTNHELDFLTQKSWLSMSLGPRILRTETAAITAASVLQAMYGDL